MRKRKNRGAIELALMTPRVEDPKIRAQVRQYVEDTVAELGGWTSLSAGELALLLNQKAALTVALCCEAEIVARGQMTTPEGKPSLLFRTLEKFQGTFRQGQVALGLARARTTSGGRTRNRNFGGTIGEIIGEYADRSEEAKNSRTR